MRCTVIEAHGAEEGIRLAARERPDLICLDLAMPGVDGFELLERLKGLPETRDILVVVVTSLALDKPARARLLESATAVLSKEQTTSVVATVERTLRERPVT